MRAGELRHRITVNGFTEAADGHGGFTPTPTTVATRIPALVETLSGFELERAAMIDPRSSRKVLLRFRDDIRAGMTVIYHDGLRGDQSLEIVAPPRDVDDRHRAMRLLCKEAE